MSGKYYILWDLKAGMWFQTPPDLTLDQPQHTINPGEAFQYHGFEHTQTIDYPWARAVPLEAAIAMYDLGVKVGIRSRESFEPVPHGIPDNTVDGRWLLWDLGDHTWRSRTGPTTQARYARAYPTMYAAIADARDSELALPMSAVTNLEVAQLSEPPATVHNPGYADRLMQEITRLADGYAGYASVVLDRHFRISVCGWDYPAEGRTVSDVLSDVLDHIGTDHA